MQSDSEECNALHLLLGLIFIDGCQQTPNLVHIPGAVPGLKINCSINQLITVKKASCNYVKYSHIQLIPMHAPG